MNNKLRFGIGTHHDTYEHDDITFDIDSVNEMAVIKVGPLFYGKLEDINNKNGEHPEKAIFFGITDINENTYIEIMISKQTFDALAEFVNKKFEGS